MVFNSLDFAVFLPVVFAIYWLLGAARIRPQNAFLLASSYVFYGWWDWRFLGLIAASTVLDFWVGLAISKQHLKVKRRLLLTISLLINLGALGIFKYCNFFVEGFVSAFSFFGSSFKAAELNVVIPVGLSFYTLQTMGYSIDVYRKKMEAHKDLLSFASFVAFFPQLVAGPIERAAHLLPQFSLRRHFLLKEAHLGLRQILWGLFKKVVIADGCAEVVDLVFMYYLKFSGLTLWLGPVFFAVQIYCDFSGYSDIAIGTARLFGFKLSQNFKFPYFSTNLIEFWRRWHISLSTWFRDYIYLPLGGNRTTPFKMGSNIMLVFLVSGLWHGADLKFLAWGGIHGILYLTTKSLQTLSNRLFTPIPSNIKQGFSIASMAFTFLLLVMSWLFFRIDSLSMLPQYLHEMFAGLTYPIGYRQTANLFTQRIGLFLPFAILGFFTVEWQGRKGLFAIETIPNTWPKSIRWLFYFVLVFLVLRLSVHQIPFIYFSF